MMFGKIVHLLETTLILISLILELGFTLSGANVVNYVCNHQNVFHIDCTETFLHDSSKLLNVSINLTNVIVYCSLAVIITTIIYFTLSKVFSVKKKWNIIISGNYLYIMGCISLSIILPVGIQINKISYTLCSHNNCPDLWLYYNYENNYEHSFSLIKFVFCTYIIAAGITYIFVDTILLCSGCHNPKINIALKDKHKSYICFYFYGLFDISIKISFIISIMAIGTTLCNNIGNLANIPSIINKIDGNITNNITNNITTCDFNNNLLFTNFHGMYNFSYIISLLIFSLALIFVIILIMLLIFKPIDNNDTFYALSTFVCEIFYIIYNIIYATLKFCYVFAMTAINKILCDSTAITGYNCPTFSIYGTYDNLYNNIKYVYISVCIIQILIMFLKFGRAFIFTYKTNNPKRDNYVKIDSDDDMENI